MVIAALMLVPQALAIGVGLDGASGSSSTTFSSTNGNSVDMTTQLSAQGMDNSGAAKMGVGVGGNIYNKWVSGDQKQTAYTYAYLDANVIYSYSFSGASTSSTATASMEVTALPITGAAAQANYFLMGGFAFNSKDYAATLVKGRLTDNTAVAPIVNNGGSITYKNSLFASASKVTATETFYGKNLEQLRAETWAERGNLASEVVDKEGTDAMWANVIANTNFAGPYYNQAAWQDSNELYAGQFMETDNLGAFAGEQVTIGSNRPYTAQASLTANTATSSQSVAFTVPLTSPASACPYFSSYALKGDLMTGSDAKADLNYDGAAGSSVTYSSKSTASASQQTSTQTKDVKKIGTTTTGTLSRAASNDYSNAIVSKQQLTINIGTGGLNPSYLSGTDSATTKKGSASATLKVTQCIGEDIQRTISADSDNADYHAAVASTIPAPGSLTNSLSGTTTATATLKGASVASAGKWTVTLCADTTASGGAVGSNFHRASTASTKNGALTWNLVEDKAANTGTTKKTYQFTEKATSTSTGLTAL